MKIKYWLMISYFIVMLLPIVALYVIYVSINSLDQKQSLLEYMEMTKTISELEAYLQDPRLYDFQPAENFEHISGLGNEAIRISLFRYDGARLYSSLESSDSGHFLFVNTANLYRNLYELEWNYRTYSLKKPVFSDGEIAGVYEIVIGRDDWVEGVNSRTQLHVMLFGGFFLLTYIIVIFLLHRKLTRPLNTLRSRMTDFAAGIPLAAPARTGNDEIGELINHFEEMREKLENTSTELMKQQEEKQFIVASLSHDLKTPLTVIQAYTEALLAEKSLAENEKNEYKEILFHKLNYMKQMLDDLVTYNALQASQMKTALVEVEAEEFFDMLLSGYGETAAKSGITLTVEQAVKGTCHVHVKQMMRVVDNIMANALRHTERGRNVWLGAFSHGMPLPHWIFPSLVDQVDNWRENGTVILIQNEGAAMTTADLEKVFQPFVQGDPARGGGSSGLGLSIAKMIMEQHDGEITIWSAADCGTLTACRLKEEKE
ncbi:Signal transduction histidine kinase [Evansella caseinilytica]|uniref:histidine kinase n=1 Tax=Evansella caseinilytica TaxID=1503961 RepID=A0A1H3IMA9_9BACI|nr:HAMP domain-containing sensor histidine kinase [Evansella caseinilytica]SDY28822.1 Signal transduction histidine kinase [Evansella caseinilytica]